MATSAEVGVWAGWHHGSKGQPHQVSLVVKVTFILSKTDCCRPSVCSWCRHWDIHEEGGRKPGEGSGKHKLENRLPG